MNLEDKKRVVSELINKIDNFDMTFYSALNKGERDSVGTIMRNALLRHLENVKTDDEFFDKFLRIPVRGMSLDERMYGGMIPPWGYHLNSMKTLLCTNGLVDLCDRQKSLS